MMRPTWNECRVCNKMTVLAQSLLNKYPIECWRDGGGREWTVGGWWWRLGGVTAIGMSKRNEHRPFSNHNDARSMFFVLLPLEICVPSSSYSRLFSGNHAWEYAFRCSAMHAIAYNSLRFYVQLLETFFSLLFCVCVWVLSPFRL